MDAAAESAGGDEVTDILTDYLEWRADQESRIGTHGDRCHMWPRHERCMIHRLAAALAAARPTDDERQAIERQADWLTRKAYQAGDIHSADLRLQEAATLRGLLERTA
jgi:hypothetical protein